MAHCSLSTLSLRAMYDFKLLSLCYIGLYAALSVNSKIVNRKDYHEFYTVDMIANPGDTIVMPCLVPWKKPLRGVKWDRSIAGDKYVLLAIDSKRDFSRQAPSYMNRSNLQDIRFPYSNPALVLKDVKESDQGYFHCSISVDGREWLTTQLVTLEVPSE